MNEQRFTPGPWAINWAGSGRDGKLVYDEVYVYAPACGVEDIAVAADIADPLTGKPSPANAALIAAAPEMLEALDKIVRYADSEPDGGHRVEMHRANIERARAAIARALPQGAPNE